MRSHAKAIVAISAVLAISILAFGITLASAAAPTVTIDPASSVSYTSVHVSGTINPNGGPQSVTYYVEYKRPADEGWNLAYGGELSGPLAEGNAPVAVGQDLAYLPPATEFEARIGAYVEGNGTFSSAVAFTTKAVAAPDVSIDPVSAITSTSAHLSGLIDPNAPEAAPTSAAVEAGFKASWMFECTPECPGTERRLH